MDRKLLWRQANALKERAQTAYNRAQWSKAEESYEAALELYRQINARSLQCRTLQLLAYIAHKRNQPLRKEALYQQALALSKACPCIKSQLLSSLAMLYAQRGDRETACQLIPQMWTTVEAQRNRGFHVSGFNAIGSFSEEIEAYDLAYSSYERALHHAQRNQVDEVMIQYYLGRVTRKQHRYEVSRAYHAEALRLCQDRRISTMEPIILQSWALLEWEMEHILEAKNLMRLAFVETHKRMEHTGHHARDMETIIGDYMMIMGSDADVFS